MKIKTERRTNASRTKYGPLKCLACSAKRLYMPIHRSLCRRAFFGLSTQNTGLATFVCPIRAQRSLTRALQRSRKTARIHCNPRGSAWLQKTRLQLKGTLALLCSGKCKLSNFKVVNEHTVGKAPFHTLAGGKEIIDTASHRQTRSKENN